MNNLKIEYANGMLVTIEHNGRSYMDLPLSALHFRHEKNHDPYFKVEIEQGGESHQQEEIPALPVEQLSSVQAESKVKEGELMLATKQVSKSRRHRRSYNKDNNHV